LIDNDDDDIIPFNSSEYEKLSLTSSINSGIDQVNSSKRSRSTNSDHQMAKSKRRMSLNVLPNLSPSIFYYSLTNINDYDDDISLKTSSKLDIGYASEDDLDKKQIYTLKKSQSDSAINFKTTSTIFSSLTHSLPLFGSNQRWRHSITSAYDTCSNPDIDLSIEETKKFSLKPSLLMYSKKYLKIKHKSSPIISHSYDASVEYIFTDSTLSSIGSFIL
jgi:hypothetical protein